MTPVQYKRPFYQIVESNRIEKSIRKRESNTFFFHESECTSQEWTPQSHQSLLEI